MRKLWIVFSFLIIQSSPLIAQSAPPPAQRGPAAAPPKQSPAEWQRKHDMALQYHSLADFYAAMKKEAASKPRAPLPDWSGIWTADSLDSFQNCLGGSQCYFRPAPGTTVGPTLTPVPIAELKHGAEMSAKGQIYDDNLSTCGPAGFSRRATGAFIRGKDVNPHENL